MRTDPTETGGLFVGRRPGTRPVRYRAVPARGTARRQRVDGAAAVVILAAMVLVNLLFWGPMPVGSLWLASRVQYWTNSVSIGIFVGFVALITALFAGLMVLRRLDLAWILVRRAAGYDQRDGAVGRIFVLTCAIGVPAFTFWLVVLSGAELAPLGISL